MWVQILAMTVVLVSLCTCVLERSTVKMVDNDGCIG